MPGTLELADAKQWQSEPGYSLYVAHTLFDAYKQIKHGRGGVRSYAHVLATAEPWIHVNMSVAQRERLYFLLGSAHGAINDYEGAANYLSSALELAALHGETDNMAHLLSQRGLMYRAMGRFAAGSADLYECLTGLPTSQVSLSQDDLAFRLRALRQYADYEFFCARFESAAAALREAQAWMPLIVGQELEKASCAWAEAHLYRQARQPKIALRIALGVLDVMTDQANPTTQDRFHAFLASLALDIVEMSELARSSTAYRTYLTLAQEHVTSALHIAEAAGDVPGSYLAQLIHARYSRFANQDGDRVAAIEVVLRAGHWLGDDGLIAQAMTLLGDELAARGETTSALNLYTQTISLLDGSELSFFKVDPLRKLLLADEWRTDD